MEARGFHDLVRQAQGGDRGAVRVPGKQVRVSEGGRDLSGRVVNSATEEPKSVTREPGLKCYLGTRLHTSRDSPGEPTGAPGEVTESPPEFHTPLPCFTA